VLGDPAAVGDPTGAGDPAGVLAALAATGLADELQAVTSKAAHVSPAQASPVRENTAPAAAGRDLRDFVVNIDSYPLKPLFNFPIAARRAMSLLRRSPRRPGWKTAGEGVSQAPFGINITAGTGRGG
jgi:hypothetical protein